MFIIQFPVEIGVGAFKISAHLLFETLAFMLGFQYYLYLKKKQADTIPNENRLWILIGATFGAFLGSRLLGALENPNHLIASNFNLLYIFRSKTIVGGLLGGLIGVELTKWLIGERQSSGDLFTLPLIFGMMIGRIGCFCNGIYEPTFGIPTQKWMGMNLGDNLMRHPVSLYEIAFLGVLWLILSQLYKRAILKSGYLFQFFLIAYLIFRFCLEWIKPSFEYSFGLTTIQIACMFGLIYYARTLFYICFNRNKLLLNDG